MFLDLSYRVIFVLSRYICLIALYLSYRVIFVLSRYFSKITFKTTRDCDRQQPPKKVFDRSYELHRWFGYSFIFLS